MACQGIFAEFLRLLIPVQKSLFCWQFHHRQLLSEAYARAGYLKDLCSLRGLGTGRCPASPGRRPGAGACQHFVHHADNTAIRVAIEA
jgi:hypothetical protein